MENKEFQKTLIYGLIGGDSMTMKLWGPEGINGVIHASITGVLNGGIILEKNFVGTATGYIQSLKNEYKGEFHGLVSFPPVPVLVPFSASFDVDSNWNGTGKFSVGRNSSPELPVKPLTTDQR